MVILGINQVSGLLTGQHDGAAALIKDGKLIATAEEERFNRIRHAKGFPHMAVAYCLKEAGLTAKDIDVIAVGYNPYAFLKRGFFFLNAPSMFMYFGALAIFHVQLKKFKLDAVKAKIRYVDHHLAHAASTYRCSGFKEINAMTIDGAGETETAAFYEGRNGVLTLRARIPFAHRYDRKTVRSIGKAYTRVTHILKLGGHGEGKTMGLASYGNPRFDFSSILNVKGWNNWVIDRRKITDLYPETVRASEQAPLTDVHKDLAASIQKALEEAVVNLGRDAHAKTGIRNFGLAGGCALNCNANSRLLEQDFCDGVFIQPAASDCGIPLGAALEVMHEVGDGDFIEFHTAYWGPAYTNEQIEKVIKNAKVSYRKSTDISKDAAKLVAEGKIVGWFQGRMELGPRALGNRSILGNPGIKDMADKINVAVKHREIWRPFAPAVPVDRASEYFEGVDKAHESPFMLHTFYVREKYRALLPSITHVDGSSRIQTVSKEQNPTFHALLEELGRLTGHPVVLNTSFNDAGEPIICSPQDALRCYYGTGFDALAIGDFILEK
jgi:carbamoyltransferase